MAEGSVDLDVTPFDNFMFGVAWDSYQTDTSLAYIVPQTLQSAMSVYAEDGELIEGVESAAHGTSSSLGTRCAESLARSSMRQPSEPRKGFSWG